MISLVIRVSNFCFFFDFLYRYGSVRIDLHVLVSMSTECRIEHTFHIVFVQCNQKHDDRSETHAQNLKKIIHRICLRIALCTTYVVFNRELVSTVLGVYMLLGISRGQEVFRS